MNYASGRYSHLVHCLAGYKKTGVSLIEYTGNQLIPTFASDDLGIYIIIPKLALLLNSSIDIAMNVFFNSIAWGSFLIGFLGFCFLYTSFFARFVSFLCLFMVTVFALMKVGDVYLVYSSCAFALVPWTLYFIHSNAWVSFCVFNMFAGYYIGTAHYIRTYASLPTLIFMLFLLMVAKIEMGKKVLIILSLFFGLSTSLYYFSSVYNTYVAYAQKNLPECAIANKSHVFWHAAYCGLGFLKFANKDNIAWDDSCGEVKVLSIDSQVTSYQTDRYESVLKKEIVKIIKEQPLFILFTIWSKIGVLLFYFLIFAHLGIIAAFIYPMAWYIYAAFFIALSTSALFPILTIPIYAYSLGFIAFSTLFAIVSVNNTYQKIGIYSIHKLKAI